MLYFRDFFVALPIRALPHGRKRALFKRLLARGIRWTASAAQYV
ncbi:hypothetical protein GTCCBUS3UF5_15190 [Geobacillus thermoleovorans CCB_US3_UF5]|uniref:Uncharacterized protein n=2 Tax=Geobacillus thermoleovorans group TaxID=1505648 RepID=S4PME9_GEOKU|nr:hypothetical protein GTCCBUS3UF5_15190 [Geobacillus thermoleovorans CCB_US3_UF5]GAD12262.1 hypothetical protein GBL_0479 [Geobacillus kaustophilus GBlys]GAJ59353.1 hypothetical protein B23_2578 [Geobacillus thermoleovorans B23]